MTGQWKDIVLIFQQNHTFTLNLCCCFMILFIVKYSCPITVFRISEYNIQDSLTGKIQCFFIQLSAFNSLYDPFVVLIASVRHLKVKSGF